MSPYGPVVDHLHAVGSKPSRNVGRVEANEVTDLDKGNPPLGDESPKVPLGGTQRLRDLLQPKEFGQLRHCGLDFCRRVEGLGGIGIGFLHVDVERRRDGHGPIHCSAYTMRRLVGTAAHPASGGRPGSSTRSIWLAAVPLNRDDCLPKQTVSRLPGPFDWQLIGRSGTADFQIRDRKNAPRGLFPAHAEQSTARLGPAWRSPVSSEGTDDGAMSTTKSPTPVRPQPPRQRPPICAPRQTSP